MNTEPKDLSEFQVLVCGLDPVTRPFLFAFLPAEQMIEVPYDLEKLAEARIDPVPILLIFGTPPEGVSLFEAAQVARMQFRTQHIYHLTSSRTNFDRPEFRKNGFTDAFLLPIDQAFAAQTIREELSRATQGAVRAYRRVQLVDLSPNERLDFDTFMYMPVNRKHLRLSAAGDELDSKQHAKLTQSGINAVHVTADQIEKFYVFTANKLRTLQKGDGLSETERKERMTNAIRNLMASVFNDSSSAATLEGGRQILADCQQIVKTFIVSENDQNSWYEKMLKATGGETSSHNHSGNVATFAALFSLAIGMGKPEEIALAGLLHDMGIADLPATIQGREYADLTAEEQIEYQKHVAHSLSIIKFRKMILPESVVKAIAQHHERWSGTGYPKGHAGTRIGIEAQILALADRFDYLTIAQDGRPRMLPGAAIRKIFDENLNDPADTQFDPELLKRFLAVFPEETASP